MSVILLSDYAKEENMQKGKGMPPIPDRSGMAPHGQPRQNFFVMACAKLKSDWTDNPAFRRGLLICVVLAVFMLISSFIFGRVCVFQIMWGYPCPGCGLLHAGFYALTFQFEKAIESNPCIFLWIPLILCAMYCYVTGKLRSKWLMTFLIVTAVITIVFYIYRMLTVFPNFPMVYYSGNLAARMRTLVF